MWGKCSILKSKIDSCHLNFENTQTICCFNLTYLKKKKCLTRPEHRYIKHNKQLFKNKTLPKKDGIHPIFILYGIINL